MKHTVHGKPAAPVLGSLLLAALAYALSQTLVAPALPALTEHYDTTPSATAWVLTGYLLSATVCTPIAGKLGDLFGKARVMSILLTLFCLGSVVCALAPSIEVVIAGRIIQGAGGGVFPLAFGIINDEMRPQDKGMSIGIMSAMFGIGGGIGLPLSGAIVDHAHISWLFWVGLVALPAAVMVVRLVPPSPARVRTPVDWAGAALLSLGLATILLAISRANTWGWGSGRTWLALLAGVGILVAFGRFELGRAHPLVDMRVLRERPVLATNITGMLVGMAMFGSFLLVPQFAQAPESTGYGFGMTVLQAGLIMTPSSVMMLFSGPLAGHLGTRLGHRAVLSLGTAALGVSFLVLTFAHDTTVEFMASNVLVGVGVAFAFASMANLVVGLVHPSQVGIATGINTIMRTIGGAFGAAVITALLTADTIPGSGQPTEHAYTEAFALALGVCVLAFAAARLIPKPGPRTGSQAVAEPA